MKKIFMLLAASLLVSIAASAQTTVISTYPYNQGFNTVDETTGWIPNNGVDGNECAGWYLHDQYYYSGTGGMILYPFTNTSPANYFAYGYVTLYTPWFVVPENAIDMEATFKFLAVPLDNEATPKGTFSIVIAKKTTYSYKFLGSYTEYPDTWETGVVNNMLNAELSEGDYLSPGDTFQIQFHYEKQTTESGQFILLFDEFQMKENTCDEFPVYSTFDALHGNCWDNENGPTWSLQNEMGIDESIALASYPYGTQGLAANATKSTVTHSVVQCPATGKFELIWYDSYMHLDETGGSSGYEVYVSTDSRSLGTIVYANDFYSEQGYTMHTVSDAKLQQLLGGSLAGKDVYISFVHNFDQNTINNAALLIDDVVLRIEGQTLGINEAKQNATFSLYPNPTNDIVNISGVQANRIDVLDLAGRCLRTVLNSNSVSLSGLANGMYMLRVNSDNGTAVNKVVKR